MWNTTYLFPILLASVLLLAGESSARTTSRDGETLLAIKKGWGNPTQLALWDPVTTADYCGWTGVNCSGGGGVVTRLSFQRLNLTGAVPASVCDLKNLTWLDLSYNNLTGAFPGAALYACSQLQFLDLSNNAFTGVLPNDISRLSPAMEHLNLSTNRFVGSVPAAVAGHPALKSLLLDTNRFTGAYPAAEISKLAGLERLTLAVNAFAPAPVPPEFAKLTKLTYLWMSGMNMTGDIPEVFSSLTELTLIDISMNKLTGAIPAWVWQHQKLEFVYLFGNGLTGEMGRNVTAVNLIELDVSSNQLTGGIPEDFGKLKNLTLMFLYFNQLTGTIPVSIALLPMLKDIRIFGNQLSGELPPELGKHSPLGNLEVSSNNLSGRLPETLCAKGKLFDIVVFNNSFSGSLPANLGDCDQLNNLMLYNNHFSGDFPMKIWSFQKMTMVMIHNNSFTGALPAEISLNISRIEMGNNRFSGSVPESATALRVFKAENNQLSGELPANMSGLASLIDLSISGNQITGSIPTSIKLLQKLNSLNLSDNRISGAIPAGSIGLLPSLTILDLSGNELTGSIPADFSNLNFNSLNMSSNQLTGEVPLSLQSAAYDHSFLGNRGLCARPDSRINLPTCRGGGGARDELSRGLIILFFMLAGIVLVGIAGIAWLLFRRRKDSQDVTDWKMTQFTPLDFTESDVLSNVREEKEVLYHLIRCDRMSAEAEACRLDYNGGAPLLEAKKGSRRRTMSDSGRWDDDEDSGNFVEQSRKDKAEANLKLGAMFAISGFVVLSGWLCLPKEDKRPNNVRFTVSLSLAFGTFLSGKALMLLSMNMLALPERLVSGSQRVASKCLFIVCTALSGLTLVSLMVLLPGRLYLCIGLAVVAMVALSIAGVHWYVRCRAGGGEEVAAYEEHMEELEATSKATSCVTNSAFGGLVGILFSASKISAHPTMAVYATIFFMFSTAIFGMLVMTVSKNVPDITNRRPRQLLIGAIKLANAFLLCSLTCAAFAATSVVLG